MAGISAMCTKRRSFRSRLGLGAVRPVALLWWGLVSIPAASAPLYVQQVEAFQPDDEILAKAREKVRKHRTVRIRDDIDAELPHFHRRGPGVKEGETFCQVCHLPLPHTRKVRTRSFLNMHSRFIACGTCHFRPRGISLTYRWLDLRSGETAPPDPGRFPSQRQEATQPFGGWIKIAPFWSGEPALPLPDSDFARQVKQRWQAGDLERRARLQARLHGPLATEGPACRDCHQEEAPLLDLVALGEDEAAARRIYHHSLPQFFQRYRKDDERIQIIDLLR